MTRAPAAASASEMARPTRTAPPVTSAVRPRRPAPVSRKPLPVGVILLSEYLEVRGMAGVHPRLRVDEVDRVVHRDRRLTIPRGDQLQLPGVSHHVTRRIHTRLVRLHE